GGYAARSTAIPLKSAGLRLRWEFQASCRADAARLQLLCPPVGGGKGLRGPQVAPERGVL
ncbi:MAG: hypothetical protein AVDCRST_MAG77-5834, partial [uncultured Chloroflexi bacterium]